MFEGDSGHPFSKLFMQFVTVIGVLVFFVIVTAQMANSLAILALGVGLLSGLIWVPHGWFAGDPVGLVQFIFRSALCFAAYLFAPENLVVVAIAAAVAVSYIHAILSMKKPGEAQ